MAARKSPETAPTPIQLSLRIRHPSIDPKKITAALGFEPEHCFKAGDPRSSRSGGSPASAGRHTETYWLGGISPDLWADPIFAALPAASDERLQAVAREMRSRGVDAVLLLFLQRLGARHSFLQTIQSSGGDVSLILGLERESATDFTLPVSVARLLVQLGISIEFRFDS
jgi:hypothetical protein